MKTTKRKTGIGSHHSTNSATDEWLTPPALVECLGPFDLDPCAMVNQPWATAAMHYTRHDDGLMRSWAGRVWMNPPYGRLVEKWLERLALHANGIALIFARTDPPWFHRQVFRHCSALLFIQRRLTFYRPDGPEAPANAGGPSCLVAYGDENAAALKRARIKGTYFQRSPAESFRFLA